MSTSSTPGYLSHGDALAACTPPRRGRGCSPDSGVEVGRGRSGYWAAGLPRLFFVSLMDK